MGDGPAERESPVAQQQLGWARQYARFLRRVGSRSSRDLLKGIVPWTAYSLLPSFVRPSSASPVFRCSDVAGAVQAFRRDGFVVLSDALDPEGVAKLRRAMTEKGEAIVRRDEAGELPEWKRHGFRRYSFGEYGHSPEWEYLGENDRVLPVLRGIWQGRDFRAVGCGGDFVLPGGSWQVLHNDMGWVAAGEPIPRVLYVNYYVSDVVVASGPIRIVPGTARFPVPPLKVITRFEPRWMKESVVTGRPGFAVIRDPRAWHGGTPNISTDARYMADIGYVLSDAPIDEVEGDTNLEQLSQGRWIAEFSNS